ncbi:hypothetical protein F5Y04DRAFT_291235 [Hypomontagnella monticulosa]|nr:hypothetical protein F5Y04DRAFT_291235 [Hypomontagnella monticulosa]
MDLQTRTDFATSAEYQRYANYYFGTEGIPIFVGLPGFFNTILGRVAGLDDAAKALLAGCGNLFQDGWQSWSENTDEKKTIDWLAVLSAKLANMAERQVHGRVISLRRLIQSDPEEDTFSEFEVGFIDEVAMIPLVNVVCKMAQRTLTQGYYRRFIWGFTLCGPIMRLWMFDRVGAIASAGFDINKDGEQFVKFILALHFMNNAEIGLNVGFTFHDGEMRLAIKREDKEESLVIEQELHRDRHLAGRGTICWKAHPVGKPEVPLVVKEFWRHPSAVDEAELIRKATEKGVVNVARYYHHEAVLINGRPDEVVNLIRGGLDMMTARDGFFGADGILQWPGFSAETPLEPKFHVRLILRDIGKPIQEARSLPALLGGFASCIEGHKSLYQAGILHGDVSLYNLMINEDPKNPSWGAFLIDLDLGLDLSLNRKEPDDETESEEGGALGTYYAMAINLLWGAPQGFMNDLESFFWCLLWLSIDCPPDDVDDAASGDSVDDHDSEDRDELMDVEKDETEADKAKVKEEEIRAEVEVDPDVDTKPKADTKSKVGTKKKNKKVVIKPKIDPDLFRGWDQVKFDFMQLADKKLTIIRKAKRFAMILDKFVDDYYKPLIPCLIALHKRVYDDGEPLWEDDITLYDDMITILRDSKKDLESAKKKRRGGRRQ